MRSASKAAWIVAIVTCVGSCAGGATPDHAPAQAPGDGAPIARAAAPPPSASPSTSATEVVAGPAPSLVPVRVALEPVGGAGERSLLVVAPGIHVREVVATVPAADRCLTRLDAGSQVLGIVCSDDLAIRVEEKEGALHAGARSFPLPAGAHLSIDGALVDPAAACAPDAKGPVVDVAITREGAGDARKLHVRVLGKDFGFFLGTRAYCHGTRQPAAQRMAVSCAFAESGASVGLVVHDAALFVEDGFKDYDTQSDSVHGGVALPCGARVRFPAVHWLDPGWIEHGFAGASCGVAFDLCTDPCNERMTDAGGELTAAGATCMQRCQEAQAACTQRAFSPAK